MMQVLLARIEAADFIFDDGCWTAGTGSTLIWDDRDRAPQLVDVRKHDVGIQLKVKFAPKVT